MSWDADDEEVVWGKSLAAVIRPLLIDFLARMGIPVRKAKRAGR